MPVPGPRTQYGPNPGYRNPDRETPTRINSWLWPKPIWWPGRTPGLMTVSLRGNILGPGTVRRFWRQSVNLIPAQAAYSWSENAPTPDRPIRSPGDYGITRALRYMTRSIAPKAGVDHTRFDAMHTVVKANTIDYTVTVGAGQKRNRPTLRNRMTSFGSRVPTLNQQVVAAESQQESGGY